MRYAFALPILLTCACVSNDVSMTIDHFAEISPANMCMTTAMTPILPFGTIDVAITQGYVASPVIGNGIVERSMTQNGAELDKILVQGFDVQIGATAAAAAALPSFFVSASTDAIPPATEGAVMATVIPQQMAAGLAPGGMVLRLRPVASHAGSTINGPWAVLPLDVCSNCLTRPASMCPNMGTPQVCFLGQDLVANCCTSAAGVTTCN